MEINDSMSSTDFADARGRNLAIAAFMSVSKFSGGYVPLKGCLKFNELRSTTMHLTDRAKVLVPVTGLSSASDGPNDGLFDPD
jgi:hypothetical protein